ncbi:DUF1842 domain-containing protein [Tenacibaculum xiamenense]|uniref:DUF1842 domain-containing protein n=1 Tax=Tenacibaculum xiamenense TaxID=1261553 RepID=UPI003895B73D
MSTQTEITTNVQTMQGTLGSSVNLNSPYVNFNLTVDEETHQVHGTVRIHMNPPVEKPYVGNVKGTVYATGYGAFTKVITLEGAIPSNDAISAIVFPFNAHFALEANDKGLGGFNFRGKHYENLPVEVRS